MPKAGCQIHLVCKDKDTYGSTQAHHIIFLLSLVPKNLYLVPQRRHAHVRRLFISFVS